MKPHDRFLSEHQTIRTLITQVRSAAAQSGEELSILYPTLQKTLRDHLRREDDIYYRTIDQRKQVQDRRLIHDVRNDHAAVVFALESLAIKLRKGSPRAEWLTRFELMSSVLLKHFDQEETEIFEGLALHLSDQERTELQARLHASYESPDER